jgi:hypothetical protein
MLRLTETRGSRVCPRLPGLAIEPDLLGLLDVERLAALVDLQRRAAGSCPAWPPIPPSRWWSRAPPDALAQAFAMRLEPQQARRVRKHRPRDWAAQSLAAQHVEKHLGVPPRHVGVALAFRGA